MSLTGIFSGKYWLERTRRVVQGAGVKAAGVDFTQVAQKRPLTIVI